ncbi:MULTISPECIES: hypothetical protein [Citrobacter]|uniref:hypothetical protein n=1 Tax=Citrobacter TaxID=544 RepID=UPI002575D7E0|nr:hypothetical protein [Citrobacter sp. Cpo150]MDM2765752.1 hypothetical protein [Citrobacter sp. Cpo150]
MRLPVLMTALTMVTIQASASNIVTPYITTVYLQKALTDSTPGQYALMEPHSHCLYFGELTEAGESVITPQYSFTVHSKQCGDLVEKVTLHSQSFALGLQPEFPIRLFSD